MIIIAVQIEINLPSFDSVITSNSALEVTGKDICLLDDRELSVTSAMTLFCGTIFSTRMIYKIIYERVHTKTSIYIKLWHLCLDEYIHIKFIWINTLNHTLWYWTLIETTYMYYIRLEHDNKMKLTYWNNPLFRPFQKRITYNHHLLTSIKELKKRHIQDASVSKNYWSQPRLFC